MIGRLFNALFFACLLLLYKPKPATSQYPGLDPRRIIWIAQLIVNKTGYAARSERDTARVIFGTAIEIKKVTPQYMDTVSPLVRTKCGAVVQADKSVA